MNFQKSRPKSILMLSYFLAKKLTSTVTLGIYRTSCLKVTCSNCIIQLSQQVYSIKLRERSVNNAPGQCTAIPQVFGRSSGSNKKYTPKGNPYSAACPMAASGLPLHHFSMSQVWPVPMEHPEPINLMIEHKTTCPFASMLAKNHSYLMRNIWSFSEKPNHRIRQFFKMNSRYYYTIS